MLCPVCSQPMVIVEFQNVELDTCVDCRGLWFDAQELSQLFELAGVPHQYHALESQLDRLPHVGARRKCPRCRRPLEPVRAPARRGAELILDECPRGDGLWFDQGELSALLEAVLGDDVDTLRNVRSYLGEFLTTKQVPGGTNDTSDTPPRT
ncbi:MAG: zf-TFIIB domain-containing protein [Pirellulaceae bacterium]|nr:zf-TFIIB domain-containing protein [Pirellulaceae bacterium]